MRNKILKRISLILVLVIAVNLIINSYFSSKSVAMPQAIPYALEVLLGLLGLLGISATINNDFNNSDIKNLADNYLNSRYEIIGDTIRLVSVVTQANLIMMREKLKSLGIYTVAQISKWTRKEVIEKYLQHFANVRKGSVDINEDNISDNIIIEFDSEEAKDVFLKDMVSDIYTSGILEDKESILKYFKGEKGQWLNFPDILEYEEYKYRYIFYERIFETPVDHVEWNAIPYFPVDDWTDKIISRSKFGEWKIIQIPSTVKLYRYYEDTWKRYNLKTDVKIKYKRWYYNNSNKSWEYSESEAGPGRYDRTIVEDFDDYTWYYLPYNVYVNSNLNEIYREADKAFLGSGMKENIKMIISRFPLTYNIDNSIDIKEFYLNNGNWVLENEGNLYRIKDMPILESNYNILDVNGNIYFRKTVIDSLNDISNISLPEINPFELELNEQPKLWSDNVISIPNTDIINDFIEDKIEVEKKTDILTDAGNIPMDLPLDDVMDYSPPFDDTEIRNGFTGVMDYLRSILNAIRDGVNTIAGSISDVLTNPVQEEEDFTEKSKQFRLPDIFLCLSDVIFACIRLVLRFSVFCIKLFSVPASDELLNEDIKNGINYIKNMDLPGYDIKIWNILSTFLTILMSINVVKKAKSFVMR